MDTQVSWTAEQVGQVLVVHRTGSQYPLGAAHGMPMSVYSHFDLTTGQRYGLADLFKAGSPYLERLQGMVAAQIAARGKDHFNHDHPAVTLAQPFAARADGLMIYYYPYEIAAYAAGFPEFMLPYREIQDLIDTEGAFWKALQVPAR
jgi:hypothetical protein